MFLWNGNNKQKKNGMSKALGSSVFNELNFIFDELLYEEKRTHLKNILRRTAINDLVNNKQCLFRC